MKNSKRILLGLLIVTIMIGVFNAVLAFDFEEDNFEPINDDRNNTTNATPAPTATSSVNDLFNGTTTATPTPKPTATPSRSNNTVNNTNASVYNNTNLPKAGSSDGIVTIVVIAIFGVVALYAYKKIREYNI